jgi:hypothetical protein
MHGPTGAFVENLNTLRRLSGLSVTMRRLDHYLWIAGAYQAAQRDATKPLNADLKEIMQDQPDDLWTLAGVEKPHRASNKRGAKRR